MRMFITCPTDDHLVFDDQGCGSDIASALAYVFNLDVPQLPSRLHVERKHMIVERSKIEHSMSDRQTARTALIGNRHLGKFVEIPPANFTCCRIDRENAVHRPH